MPAMVYDQQTERRTDGDKHPIFGTREVMGHLAHEMNGQALVTIEDGEKIGEVADMLFDPQALRIAALTFTKGGLLNRETFTLPANQVRVWGKDVILVNRPGELQSVNTQQQQNWVKLSDQLRGRYVVSTDGTRVGQVNDVLIDDQGQLAGYDLSQVFIEGPLAEAKRIPVEATSSLGKDVLIVDTSKI